MPTLFQAWGSSSSPPLLIMEQSLPIPQPTRRVPHPLGSLLGPPGWLPPRAGGQQGAAHCHGLSGQRQPRTVGRDLTSPPPRAQATLQPKPKTGPLAWHLSQETPACPPRRLPLPLFLAEPGVPLRLSGCVACSFRALGRMVWGDESLQGPPTPDPSHSGAGSQPLETRPSWSLAALLPLPLLFLAVFSLES